MDFLKEILGEDLFKQFTEKINAFNGNEENKDKRIKLANLGAGAYVSKEKYASLETENNSKIAELDNANNLIAELKKSTKGNEDLQGKITGYESQVAELQAELEKTKLDAAIKVALLSEKAMDIDYLMFKLKEKGETLELEKNGKIKGWNDKISGLKTQFPTQFESSVSKKINEHKLEEGNDENALTRAEILKKPYAERQEIYQKDPDAYKEIMKGD